MQISLKVILDPQLVRVRLSALGVGIVLVEIPRVRGVPQVWNNRSRHPPMVQIVPVDVLKPFVVLNRLRAAFDVP